MLGQSPSKLKENLKSYQAAFLTPLSMKLEINYKKKTGKFINMWRLNNMVLNKQGVKREIKKYFGTKEHGNTT